MSLRIFTLVVSVLATSLVTTSTAAAASEPARTSHVSVHGESYGLWPMTDAAHDLELDEEPTSMFIERLYLGLLGRNAEAEGLAYWVATGLSKASLVDTFLDTPEFHNLGLLSDADFAEFLYGTVLDRASDSEGQQYWVADLGAGVPRSHVTLYFVDSQEYRNRLQDNGHDYRSVRPVRFPPRYSDAELEATIVAAFPEGQVANAKAIVQCESGGDSSLVYGPNTDGTYDWGLFQINTYHHAGQLEQLMSYTPDDIDRTIVEYGFPDALLDGKVSVWAARWIIATEQWRAKYPWGQARAWRGQGWGSWTCANPSKVGAWWDYDDPANK